jgi:methylmalonyl-CoA/ethylmalonyl-CoA epimerase
MPDLVQVAQRAEDLTRARDFYRMLLRLEPTAQFDPPGLVFFDLSGTRLLLDRAAPSALIYVAVDDVRTRIEELRAEGVDIEGEPQVIFQHADDTLGPAATDEWMAFVKDSEGNTVGLVSHEPRHDP